jgi:ribosomal protein L29
MKKREFDELKKKEIVELRQVLADKKLDYLKARTNIKAGKEKNLKAAKNTKSDVAKIETLLREKEFMAQTKGETK